MELTTAEQTLNSTKQTKNATPRSFLSNPSLYVQVNFVAIIMTVLGAFAFKHTTSIGWALSLPITLLITAVSLRIICFFSENDVQKTLHWIGRTGTYVAMISVGHHFPDYVLWAQAKFSAKLVHLLDLNTIQVIQIILILVPTVRLITLVLKRLRSLSPMFIEGPDGKKGKDGVGLFYKKDILQTEQQIVSEVAIFFFTINAVPFIHLASSCYDTIRNLF